MAVNIVNVASLRGMLTAGDIPASRTTVLDVPTDDVFKVNTIIIANIDGTNSADITIEVSVNNGTNYYAIAKTVPVPADSSLSIIDTALYLDETDILALTASVAGDLTYVISYELIE